MNVMTKATGLEYIQKDFEALGTALSREIALYVKDELTMYYKEMLQNFYNEYTPKMYSIYNNNERTYQLLKHSYVPYYKAPHGNRAIAGIVLTPEEMKYENDYNPSQVISDFLAGLHGGRISVNGTYPLLSLYRRVDFLIADICSPSGKAYKKIISAANGRINLSTIKTIK